MKKILFVAITIMIAFTSISAQRFEGIGYRDSALKEKLNLNDEQAAKFSDIHYKHQQSMIDIKSEIEKNRLEIKKMMIDNKVDTDNLKNLVQKNSALKNKIDESRTAMWIDIYNILNKDQKEIWTKHFVRMGEFQKQRKHHKGNFMGRRDGEGRGLMQKNRMLD